MNSRLKRSSRVRRWWVAAGTLVVLLGALWLALERRQARAVRATAAGWQSEAVVHMQGQLPATVPPPAGAQAGSSVPPQAAGGVASAPREAEADGSDTPIARLLRGGQTLATASLPPGGDGQARQVRLVRVEGQKYPLLRVEEPVAGSAPDGAGSAGAVTVAVADHFIVKRGTGTEERAFREELARRGYHLRKKMLAPDTYLVGFESPEVKELVFKYENARKELGSLGRVEPDYVVEALADPNDTYDHLLWGLHNVSASVTVVSGAGTGSVYAEGGKMEYAGEVPAAGITAALVNCGLGLAAGDFPAAVNGNIALIQRGTNTFASKVTLAKNAGAVAVLIYNHEPGGFNGTLSALGDWPPVIPLSQSAGQALTAALPGTVTLSVAGNGRDISARTAWNTQTGSANVLLGVIDTGIDYRHPDLAANIWTNPGEVAANGLDDDGNGFIDDVHGWDFANDDADPMDDNNHGTHCAGTIGGVGNNQLGVAGVCWQVRMAGIKFLTAGGSGYNSDAIDSIYYATRIGTRLTSNSWGGGGYSQAMVDAIADANAHGMLFVAAAGNAATSVPMFPGGYDNENIVSVAATDSADQLASFSNYGVPHVDLAAPGVSILSTVPLFNDPPYKFFNGTSMACPHVAGAAALLLAQAPSIPHLDLRARLLATVDPVPVLTGRCVTGGRLNVAAAITGLFEEPSFELVSIAVSDSAPGGNDDSVINPGEAISLSVTIRNRGYQGASNVHATLSSADPLVTVTDAGCAFGSTAARGQATAQDPLAMSISAATPVPHTVNATLTLTDALARTWTLPVVLQVSSTHHLSGGVTLDGLPLAGATIHYEGTLTGTVTTDAAGAFDLALPIGAYALRASYAGTELSRTVPQQFTTPGSTSGISFAMTTATISGSVLDHATGSPVPGAQVTFLGPVTETATTGADGSFNLTRIYGRPVSWRLVASKSPDYDYPSSALNVTVPPSATGLEFRMGWPEINFDAGSAMGYTMTLAPGTTGSATLTLSNHGVADLDWQLSGISNGGGTRGTELGQFDAPSGIATTPEGSAYDGTYLYWLDGGMLYQQAKTGALVTKDYLPESIVGFQPSWRLALFDGRHFWFEELVPDPNDSGHRFINLHAVDLASHLIVETIEVDRQLHVSTSSSEGAFWANARCGALAEGVFFFYWARPDFSDGKRYIAMARIDRASGALLSSYRLPSVVNAPFGNYDFMDFTYMNGALWMIRSERNVSNNRVIYKLDPATGTVLTSFTAANFRFREIFADETGALWLFADTASPRKVYRYDSGDRLWMTADQTIGELAPGQSTTLTLTFDASIVGTGIYHGAVRISSNDPDRPRVYVPLVLNVTSGTPGNDPPVITSATPASPITLNENSTQVFTIANSDANGDTLTRQWAFDGKIVTGGGTSWTYNIGYASQGAHALAVRVSDGKGGIATKIWQIFVNNLNRPPVAQDASYLVANTDELALGLVASDPDGEPLTWEILTPPASGTLTGNAPNLRYRPAANFTGTVTFTYKVNDGIADSNIATVTINVGYRDVDTDTTALVVTAAHGERPTRTFPVRNTGTTPLRWSAPMTWTTLPVSAGVVEQAISSLPLPTGVPFLSSPKGLAFDGTHLLSSALELDASNAFYRSHLMRIDPVTGQMVGSSLPAPTTSSLDYMWMEKFTWTGSTIWALNDDWVSTHLDSRMFEFGLGAGSLNLLNNFSQLPTDYGGYNFGITWGNGSLWLAVGATSDAPDLGGLYRLQSGTKTVLDEFELPISEGWEGGPLAYWNGALWLADRLGGPLRKLNPFTGATLSMVPVLHYIEADGIAEDRAGRFFIKEDKTVWRTHSGDYLLMSPDGGTLPGGTETTVTVTFDSVLAGPGTHTGHIHVLSDDPDEPDVLIPVTFMVTSAAGNTAPQITATSPSSPATVATRQRTTCSVTASDAEGHPLTYRWYLNGVRQVLADNQTAFDFVAPPAAALHTLRVEIDDGHGGLATHTWQIHAQSAPLAVQALAEPARGLAPLPVSLSALVSGGTANDGPIAGEPDFIVIEAENFHRSALVEPPGNPFYAEWYDLGIPSYWGAVGSLVHGEISPFSTLAPWEQAAEIAYDIQFPSSGTYYLWMRGASDADSQNSCWVGLDGLQVGGPFDDVDGGPHRVLRWVKHSTPFVVSRGRHTFSIRTRETDYKVDRILFTTDANFIPSNRGPLWESPRLPAVTYAWGFGDGTPGSNTADPVHTYTNVGTYLASVSIHHGTGSAVGTVQITAQMTYSAWVTAMLSGRPASDQPPTANPDGDAFSNLLEYALGLDPLHAEGDSVFQIGEVEHQGQTYLALTYRRPTDRGGIVYLIEVSNDLTTWSNNEGGTAVTTIESLTPHPDHTETVIERDLLPMQSTARHFMRLRIELR